MENLHSRLQSQFYIVTVFTDTKINTYLSRLIASQRLFIIFEYIQP